MVTFINEAVTTSGKLYVKGACLSTDEKPTCYVNGSRLIEMDTSKLFMFDEEHGEWLEIDREFLERNSAILKTIL